MTENDVILDSVFCVLQGFIEIIKFVIFASYLIKKRRYWTIHAPGDFIYDHFSMRYVGSNKIPKGKLDIINYNILCLKETNYAMNLMSNYYGLTEYPHQNMSTLKFTNLEGEENSAEFKLKILFANHFNYLHVVDNNNNLRHYYYHLDYTWVNHFWTIRGFYLLLDDAEVNYDLGFKYLVSRNQEKNPPALLQLRKICF